jgi:hypothetical protein
LAWDMARVAAHPKPRLGEVAEAWTTCTIVCGSLAKVLNGGVSSNCRNRGRRPTGLVPWPPAAESRSGLHMCTVFFPHASLRLSDARSSL